MILLQNNKFLLFVILLCFFIGSCSSSYDSVLLKTENNFNAGNYKAAVDQIRDLVKDAGTKDKQLYLLEAGVILHTMGEYKKSNDAFNDADYIAETIKTSVSKEALSSSQNKE